MFLSGQNADFSYRIKKSVNVHYMSSGEPEYEPVVEISPRDIIWDPHNPDFYDLQIPGVIETTMNEIYFFRRADHQSSPVKDQSDDPATQILHRRLRNERCKAFRMLQSSLPFVEQLLKPVFWLIHLSLFFPECTHEIKKLNGIVSRMWHDFLFPLRTNNSKDNKDQQAIDKMIQAMTYFMTQALQDIFQRILCGHPESMAREFRMKLCAMIVHLFSGVKPIDSLLKSRLAFFFQFPPRADIPDRPEVVDDDYYEKVTLPMEDLDTLIQIPRRLRPIGNHWRVAALAPLLATCMKRETLPLTRDATLIIQMPQNGEADWTTDLPPLLPHIQQQKEVTVENYNPMGENRSLMHRSVRPNIVPDYKKDKTTFMKKERERKAKKVAGREARVAAIAHARACASPVLTKFVTDLRKLQVEKKRGETPEFEDELNKKEEDVPDATVARTAAVIAQLSDKQGEEARVKFDDLEGVYIHKHDFDLPI